MIHDFLIWLGWDVSAVISPPVPTFWATPLGLACSFVIMIYSGARVLHPHYKADWLDSIFNMLFSILFMAAFIGGIFKDEPHYIVKTWLILSALRCICRALVDWITCNKMAR